MTKILRNHQKEVVDAVFRYFESGKTGNPVVQACVGSGKSLCIAEFMRQACEMYAETRFIVLAHVSELLTQIHEEQVEIWPNAYSTFYADKLNKKDLKGDIIYASIQSIYAKAFDIKHGIDMVLVDECHLLSDDDDTMYQRFINDLKMANPHLKIVGFTGTPFRQGSGAICGHGKLFSEIIYRFGILDGIEAGYLCEPITPKMKTRMSTEGVPIVRGDYAEGALQRAVDKREITVACVDELMEHGSDRKKWLIFTAGITHCEHVRDEIRSRGLHCEMITGKTPKKERARIIDDYKNGTLRCLVVVACFTTGFNNPAIDLIGFFRPCRSAVLYCQCIGRGIRSYPGKKDCLVLDFGDVVSTLGPVDQIDVKYNPTKSGDAPVKICPKCESVCYAGTRVCADCGNVFEFNKTRIGKKPGESPVLSTQTAPDYHNVIGMEMAEHIKRSDKTAPTTLRVTYFCSNNKTFSEYICFNHKGFARDKAVKWHQLRFPNIPTPTSVEEARKMLYPIPTQIEVMPEGKYWRVTAYNFESLDPPDAPVHEHVEEEPPYEYAPIDENTWDDIPF